MREQGRLPRTYQLSANSPNPFSSRTWIAFDLPKATEVSLAIYDLNGRRVKTLLAGESMGPGRWQLIWDGSDDDGCQLRAGIYYYKLIADNYSKIRKMAIFR